MSVSLKPPVSLLSVSLFASALAYPPRYGLQLALPLVRRGCLVGTDRRHHCSANSLGLTILCSAFSQLFTPLLTFDPRFSLSLGQHHGVTLSSRQLVSWSAIDCECGHWLTRLFSWGWGTSGQNCRHGNSWSNWGRWVAFAVIVGVAILIFFLLAYVAFVPDGPRPELTLPIDASTPVAVVAVG